MIYNSHLSLEQVVFLKKWHVFLFSAEILPVLSIPRAVIPLLHGIQLRWFRKKSSKCHAGPWIKSRAGLDKPAPACSKPGASRTY